MASDNTTSAAPFSPYGVSSATHGAQPSIQLYPYDAAYMLSSSTNSAGVSETTRVLAAAPAGELSLNGLPPDPQVYDAYQPQPYVGNTNGGPCPPYSLAPDNRLYYVDSTMPIQGHLSTEALNALSSQQFHITGQSGSMNIARPRSQQQYIFHGVPPFGPTNAGVFQQYPHSSGYTVSQDLCPKPPLDIVVCLALPATAPIYLHSKKNWLFPVSCQFFPKSSSIEVATHSFYHFRHHKRATLSLIRSKTQIFHTRLILITLTWEEDRMIPVTLVKQL